MAARLTPAALRVELAAGRIAPLYLVIGEDEAEKASLAAAFADVVEPDLRAFNVERIYGGEARDGQPAIGRVLDAVRTLPMLAPRRIVIVLEAEKLLAPKRDSEAAEAELDRLGRYVKAPLAEATLVLLAGAVDRRRAVAKLLWQHATLVVCGAPEFAADAEDWVRGQAARAGVTIERAAVRLLVDRAGFVDARAATRRQREQPPGDIGRLRADLDRACLFALERRHVTAADVKEVSGPAAAQDAWGVVRALERGDAAGALAEMGLLVEAGGSPFAILGQLRWFVEQAIPSAGLPRAVDALLRTDLALKGSRVEPRVLLERLVVELAGLGVVASRSSRRAGPPGAG